MNNLSDLSISQFSSHVASQHHAMAGATIAASAALVCGLGTACVRISMLHMESADEQTRAAGVADRLAAITVQLRDLCEEDGAAITTYAALRDAGQELQGQERLCQMPVEVSRLAAEAAMLLQDFRPLVIHVQDDLEMAIRLLDGSARAAALLLDSNLRIWPDPTLLETFEPQLAELNALFENLNPVGRVRAVGS